MTKKNEWETKDIETAKGTTYIAIVIDKSSSMGGVKEQAVAGYNDTVEDLWELSKDNDIKVSLVTFDTHVYEHLWNVPASDLKLANYDSFRPQKCTALWDGMGYTLDRLMEIELTDDDAVLMIVISDGCENSSNNIEPAKLRSKIEETQESGKWTFTYMGCNMHTLKRVSEQSGIPISNMAAWDASDNAGTGRAMAQNKGKLGNYMEARSKSVNSTSNFHSETTGVAADYSTEDGHGVDKSVTLRCSNLMPDFDTINNLMNDRNQSFTSCGTSAKPTIANVEGGEDVFAVSGQVDFKKYNVKNIV
ncbi:MAG: vWA domain-containing protein [Candidatus Thorarchaeota archaeon]|jgi:hypothetical protein